MRDGTKISFENGKKMMEIFKEANEENSIFTVFNYMD